MSRGDKKVNIPGSRGFEHLFISDIGNMRARVNKLNEDMKKLNRKITQLTEEYEAKLIEKAKLLDEIERDRKRGKKDD